MGRDIGISESYYRPQERVDVKEVHQDTPSLQQLIVSLRTAIVSDGWKLDKQQTSHQDTLDGLRLSLCNYQFLKNNTL